MVDSIQALNDFAKELTSAANQLDGRSLSLTKTHKLTEKLFNQSQRVAQVSGDALLQSRINDLQKQYCDVVSRVELVAVQRQEEDRKVVCEINRISNAVELVGLTPSKDYEEKSLELDALKNMLIFLKKSSFYNEEYLTKKFDEAERRINHLQFYSTYPFLEELDEDSYQTESFCFQLKEILQKYEKKEIGDEEIFKCLSDNQRQFISSHITGKPFVVLSKKEKEKALYEFKEKLKFLSNVAESLYFGYSKAVENFMKMSNEIQTAVSQNLFKRYGKNLSDVLKEENSNLKMVSIALVEFIEDSIFG